MGPEKPDLTAHHPAMQGMRSVLFGVCANLVLALSKGVAGYLGNSYALIADAIESLSDVVTSLIVWAGLRVSAKPPDENHPYGHGKAETIAAALVGLALLGAAVVIVVQSIREIITPHHSPAPFTLAVLAGVILTKEGLYRLVHRTGQQISSTAVRGDAWHHRSDALTSAAAFVGISVSLLMGPGWESADDWAALFASGIIVLNGYRILKEALLELSDAAPDPATEIAVRNIASGVAGVEGLHRCRVRKVGFDHYVELDVLVDAHMPTHQAHGIAHSVQDSVREALPRVRRVLVHIEPTSQDRQS